MHKNPSHLNAFVLLLILSAGMMSMAAQEVSIKGSVINPSQHPVGNVKVYLKSNPSIYCYSDSNGMFELSSTTTSVAALVYNDRISVNPDGSLQIHALQNSLSIDIYDLLGRRVKEVIHRENLNGIYRIHPGAYLNDLPGAIYIARVRVDEYSKGIKVRNLRTVDYPVGLTRIADYEVLPEPALKSDVAEDDTLVFSSDFYRPASLAISSYSGDVGVIQLENFGDYTVAEGMDPDKTRIDKTYGGFLYLTSEEDIIFHFDFDSLCYFGEEKEFNAIPISSLNFLPDNLEFISGIHLEPSGTRLLAPARVIIELQGPLPDSLVVFTYHNDSEKIYFLPFKSYAEDYFSESGTYHLETYLSHFSGIGVANATIPDKSQAEQKTVDDYISELAYYQQQNEDITDEVWTNYYDEIILSLFEGVSKSFEEVNSLESLKQLISDMLEYLENRQLLGVETRFQDTQEYADFLSMLTEEIIDLYSGYNNDCLSSNDDCEKSEEVKNAIEVLSLGQYFGLDGSLPDIHDFCNNGITDLVNAIHFNDDIIYLKPGHNKSIPYTLTNLYHQTITDKSITWISNDPDIVSVNQSGEIQGLKSGTTRIVASWCDVKNSVMVKVTDTDCSTANCEYTEACYEKGTFSGKGRLKIHWKTPPGAYEPRYWDKIISFSFRFSIFDKYGDIGYDIDYFYYFTGASYSLDTKRWTYYVSDVTKGSVVGGLYCYEGKWAEGGSWVGPFGIPELIYHGDYLRVVFEDCSYPTYYTGVAICPRVSK